MSVSQEKRDKLHLLHIRDSAEKVEGYSNGLSYEKFAKSKLEYDAIMLQIVVIGEAVNDLGKELKEKYRKLPWRQIIDTRNHIAHGYFDIDTKTAWDIATEDLPKLKREVEKILEKM